MMSESLAQYQLGNSASVKDKVAAFMHEKTYTWWQCANMLLGSRDK